MKKEYADKWVQRLRDPNERQARNVLNNGKGKCCLGVLAQLLVEELPHRFTWDFSEGRFYDSLKRGGSSHVLVNGAMDLSGLQNSCGTFDTTAKIPDSFPKDFSQILQEEGSYDLAGLNDNLKLDFNRIADFIELNWEKL
jgi:hypothetical protein